jgi:hypothetical protein
MNNFNKINLFYITGIFGFTRGIDIFLDNEKIFQVNETEYEEIIKQLALVAFPPNNNYLKDSYCTRLNFALLNFINQKIENEIFLKKFNLTRFKDLINKMSESYKFLLRDVVSSQTFCL